MVVDSISKLFKWCQFAGYDKVLEASYYTSVPLKKRNHKICSRTKSVEEETLKLNSIKGFFSINRDNTFIKISRAGIKYVKLVLKYEWQPLVIYFTEDRIKDPGETLIFSVNFSALPSFKYRPKCKTLEMRSTYKSSFNKKI